MELKEQKQILNQKREEMYMVLKEKDLSDLTTKELKEVLALIDTLKAGIVESNNGWGLV